MRLVVANIHRIMILSGLLTMTMIYAALAPDASFDVRRKRERTKAAPLFARCVGLDRDRAFYSTVPIVIAWWCPRWFPLAVH